MITIALADKNPTFCQGLKTMLGQVDDFRIFILPPDTFAIETFDNASPDVLLIDADLYLTYKKKVGGLRRIEPIRKTILLTMESDELPVRADDLKSLKKGSGKTDFENLIREMSAGISKRQFQHISSNSCL